MDRNSPREDLVLAMLESRHSAGQVRAVLDSSEFGTHTALVMLLADHDLHRPDSPAAGPERHASVAGYVREIAAAARHAGPRARGTDPRWALVADAQASLVWLAGRTPTSAEVHALLRAVLAARPHPGPAQVRSPKDVPLVPRPNGPDTRRTRSDDRRS
ncbi:hypothetical protein OEB99_10050 [Actinotalea sp. M2MS4P-6]|uniref:hypothetical protein n=1 Tax=Actinotalea sp. M2MS4P-6 TaxID=2983762 RepID=UPI0021E490B9|nr:hypothetical protein [Actinotalea sp. M2MS4P-6]MCV2394649.1 hypothetical protein [Actinotalea sp. M2MS4P-6]